MIQKAKLIFITLPIALVLWFLFTIKFLKYEDDINIGWDSKEKK